MSRVGTAKFSCVGRVTVRGTTFQIPEYLVGLLLGKGLVRISQGSLGGLEALKD
jgi:hypothetical protein